jgi:hypothetical protein
MFVGHYAAALALRPLKKSPSLPVLFAGVQLVDIGFFTLAISGAEQFRITPGITAMNGLDLYFMPYTHSLLGSATFALGFGILLAAFAGAGARWTAGIIGAVAVMSHWLLDYLVHRPDLGIVGDFDKVGLGLWNRPNIEMPLEIGLVFIAFGLYLLMTKARGARSSWAAVAVGVVLLGAQAFNWFGPQPTPETPTAEIAAQGLLAFGVFIALAFWLERSREAS